MPTLKEVITKHINELDTLAVGYMKSEDFVTMLTLDYWQSLERRLIGAPAIPSRLPENVTKPEDLIKD